MACHGAARLGVMADNAAAIIAMEWMAAAQGVDFHRPLQPAPPLAEALKTLRAKVPRLDRDRFFAPDIAEAKSMLLAGALDRLVNTPLVASRGI